MLVGDDSQLGCRLSNEARPAVTLSWYRQEEPGSLPQLINYSTDVAPAEIVNLEHSYTHQDHRALFYCEATQPTVDASQPVQSDRVEIIMQGKFNRLLYTTPHYLGVVCLDYYIDSHVIPTIHASHFLICICIICFYVDSSFLYVDNCSFYNFNPSRKL